MHAMGYCFNSILSVLRFPTREIWPWGRRDHWDVTTSKLDHGRDNSYFAPSFGLNNSWHGKNKFCTKMSTFSFYVKLLFLDLVPIQHMAIYEHGLILICHSSENRPASILGQQCRRQLAQRWMISYSQVGRSFSFHERNCCVTGHVFCLIANLLYIHM
jgi:hypothetical protein